MSKCCSLPAYNDASSRVGSSRVESRQVEPTRAAIQEERVKEKREESSFSPFPSQSGVSDSRSAASTPTVGTLTLQILIRRLGETSLLTLQSNGVSKFFKRRCFLASRSPLGLPLYSPYNFHLLSKTSLDRIYHLQNIYASFTYASPRRVSMRICVRQNTVRESPSMAPMCRRLNRLCSSVHYCAWNRRRENTRRRLKKIKSTTG